MKKVIVFNLTDDYSDYSYGIVDCATGKPLEGIWFYCSGSSIETEELFNQVKELNLYSDFCEQPCDLIQGKRPIDIADYDWFGGIIAAIVLAGIKANRPDYEVVYTYGMSEGDGWKPVLIGANDDQD